MQPESEQENRDCGEAAGKNASSETAEGAEGSQAEESGAEEKTGADGEQAEEGGEESQAQTVKKVPAGRHVRTAGTPTGKFVAESVRGREAECAVLRQILSPGGY